MASYAFTGIFILFPFPPLRDCTNQSLSRFSLQKYLSKLNLELQKLCAECSELSVSLCLERANKSMIMEMGAIENSIYHLHASHWIGLDCIA